ncbi:Nuclease-related domain-containing protein [Propionispira arboris]|uniref:Nuclease-related domain-containing protein n=1 Tax=Propionispira arboris TaxID=84035 RepID=A0A1H6TSV9_9FIRM|nr:nuclease-related domain-containing protein [Propionispira arboris]SEI79320.1 Nuclease-related domain-containing protein [Propionispira arboris]
MANVHKGKKTLNRQSRQYLFSAFVCAGLIGAYVVMIFRLGEELSINPFFHLLPVIWLMGIFYYCRRYRILQAGARGENEILTYVRNLPNQYHVFSNFVIQEKRIRDEADFIVVGENGVFVVEGKNHLGKIVGTEDDIEWKQYKFGQKGKLYTKNMMNPIKQTKWHRHNIEGMLRNAGFCISVVPLLVFTNTAVQLEIISSEIVVLKGSKYVNDYILRYSPQRKLDKHMIKDIVALLEKKARVIQS